MNHIVLIKNYLIVYLKLAERAELNGAGGLGN